MPTLRRLALAALLSCAVLLSCKAPAAAFDLFATQEVTVQFATADGKAMADAEVKVYAPGDPTHVVKTGRTDKDGKFTFGVDRDGLWTAEAHIAGDIARATIRVGGAGGGAGGGERGDVSPYLIIGGLGALLVARGRYRFVRARAHAATAERRQRWF